MSSKSSCVAETFGMLGQRRIRGSVVMVRCFGVHFLWGI